MPANEWLPYLRSLWTLWFFLAFTAVIVWTLWPARKARLEALGRIPLEDSADTGDRRHGG